MVGVPVLVGDDRAEAIVVTIAEVMVVGHGQPVLDRVPIREAMAHLGEEEGHGHDQGQQRPSQARQVRRRHWLKDNGRQRRANTPAPVELVCSPLGSPLLGLGPNHDTCTLLAHC